MGKKAFTGKHQYTEFKMETMVNRIKKMMDMKDTYTDVSDLHVKLSYGNRKTTALVPSVSLIPVADCGNCSLCAKGCYDVRHICCYDESQRQRANNSALLMKDRVRYFKEIEAHAQFHRFFRWHVGGDIVDYDYLARMVGIAERTPSCEFLAFTKMFDIVNEWLDRHGQFPDNLHIILSDWRGMAMDNRHNLPVSSPIWRDGTTGPNCTDERFLCPGNCGECASVNGGCWGAKKGDTILFEAH